MLGLMVEVEQARTEKRLPHILPLLLASLTVSEGEQEDKKLCKKPPLEVIHIAEREREMCVL